MPAIRFQSPLIIGAALLLGIAGGCLLPVSALEEERMTPRKSHSHSSDEPDASTFKARQRPPAANATASPAPADNFVVPPEAMERIRLDLLDGTSLNRKECEILGLSESQIQKLKGVVDAAIARWQERERASMKIVPSSGGKTLIHIPPADPAVSEKEWQVLKASMLEIGGAELEPLLHYRLTDGNSPSRYTNAGTGMLNVLTAGYGTFDRLVRVTPSPDGSTVYDIIDVGRMRPKNATMDEAFFNELKDSGSHDGSKHFRSDKIPDQLNHLLPLK